MQWNLIHLAMPFKIMIILENLAEILIGRNFVGTLCVRLLIACSNTFSGARASFCWASCSSGLLPGFCASLLQGGNLISAVGYWTRKKRRVAARRLNWSLLERLARERAKCVVEAPKSPKQLILNFSESSFYPTFPYALSLAHQKHWSQNSASFLLVIRTACTYFR